MGSRLLRSATSPLAILAILAALAGCGADPIGGAVAGGGFDGKPKEKPGAGGAGGVDVGAGGVGGSDVGESLLRLEKASPPRGLGAGGETVVLSGSGFVERIARGERISVFFGSNPAIGARVIDDSTIYLAAPPGSLGVVDISLRTASAEVVCEGCYRYLEPSEILSIEPAEGSIHGGDAVVLRGSGLRAGMIVTFGGRAALAVSDGGDGSLVLIAPPGDREGPVDVRGFDEDGAAFVRKGFTYVESLRIDSIDPPGGPMAGGFRIRIAGAGFGPDAAIFLGQAPIPTTVESASMVTALLPAAEAPGAVELSIRSRREIVAAPFAFFDPREDRLELYAVSPPSGSTNGGESRILVGSGLDGGQLASRFGGVFVANTESDGPHFLRVEAPAASSAGTVDVDVRVATGFASLAAAYRYQEPFSVSSVSPAAGGSEGGTAIEVRGVGFPVGARLFVGALEATEVQRLGSDRITARSPRGSEGLVPLRVMAPGDGRSAILPDAFRYDGPLALSVLEPSTGARAGGTRITLRGSGFRDGMRVHFGDAEAELVEVLDPFTATASTPRSNAGIVDVEIIRDDGARAEVMGAFTYLNPASSGGSSGGALNGSLNVTALNGSRDHYGTPLPGATVTLGSGEAIELRGITDDRGQLTLSSSLLVKPQVVTVSLSGFESATVVNQRSENLTVLLSPHAASSSESDGTGQGSGVLAGKVWGFKRPPHRILGPTERELAMVGLSEESIYAAAPFGWGTPTVKVGKDGGTFQLPVTSTRNAAVYAVYGIYDDVSGAFERLLMGVSRGVDLVEGETRHADVILDLRLDLEVPITLLNPPGGQSASTVYAYVDLGGQGVIPVGSAIASGGGFGGAPATGRLLRLPRLSGESFVFQVWGGGMPITATFRRQVGDLSQGVELGPLLGLTNITQPRSSFEGVIEWERGAGPEPEIAYVIIELPRQGAPALPIWHIVLPGSERRVTMPTSVVDGLRASFPEGTTLRLTLITGSEPRFSFDQWDYSDTSMASYTSFTYDQITFGL